MSQDLRPIDEKLCERIVMLALALVSTRTPVEYTLAEARLLETASALAMHRS